jgi:uncharacterized protein YndB with AHSA1/START domain
MTATSTTQTGEKDIVITREFAAPRQLVWDVWTTPKHLEKWFGPKGFNTRVETLEFRVGGRSSYIMVGPDGTEYPAVGVFKEIVPIEKIVSTDEWGEGYEELAAKKHIDLPQGMVLTALFNDLGERTKLTLITTHQSVEDRKKHEEMGVVDGWNSSFDKMDTYLDELQK